MSSFLERVSLRIVGLILTVVLWPLVALSMVAEAITYIDPKLEDI